MDVIDCESSPLAGFGISNVGLSGSDIRRFMYSNSGMNKYWGPGSLGDGILYGDA